MLPLPGCGDTAGPLRGVRTHRTPPLGEHDLALRLRRVLLLCPFGGRSDPAGGGGSPCRSRGQSRQHGGGRRVAARLLYVRPTPVYGGVPSGPSLPTRARLPPSKWRRSAPQCFPGARARASSAKGPAWEPGEERAGPRFRPLRDVTEPSRTFPAALGIPRARPAPAAGVPGAAVIDRAAAQARRRRRGECRHGAGTGPSDPS